MSRRRRSSTIREPGRPVEGVLQRFIDVSSRRASREGGWYSFDEDEGHRVVDMHRMDGLKERELCFSVGGFDGVRTDSAKISRRATGERTSHRRRTQEMIGRSGVARPLTHCGQRGCRVCLSTPTTPWTSLSHYDSTAGTPHDSTVRCIMTSTYPGPSGSGPD